MSSAAAPQFPPIDATSPQSALDHAEESKSFGRRVFEDTFKNYRARAGILWIGVLLFMAVFAPFLASSHPLLMKMDGRWSSPLLVHLTQTDVTLLVAFVVGVVLLIVWGITWPQKMAILIWLIAVALLLVWWPALIGSFKGKTGAFLLLLVLMDLAVIAWILYALDVPRRGKSMMIAGAIVLMALLLLFPIRPPQTVVYSQYREWTRAGKIQKQILPPIPYSAGDRQRDIRDARLQPPSDKHLMGTENNGSDVLSRIIHASRIALAIGFISTGIAVLIGAVIGAIMGYYVGKLDILGMRLIEIFEAVPTLILLLTFVAFFGRNLYLMMAIIGFVSWTGDARFVRAEFLRLRKQDFVQAAVALGLPTRSVLFRHMLPNGIAPLLVGASFGVASAILYEATLSFLGLGLVDEPSWGQLLNQVIGSAGGQFVWWLALFPGLMIFLTVYAYNLVGESLRDALDPKLRGR
ncbi:MAG TPA: ABC transporter permease [Tepidisphaeraceae bacterium]|jgi:peptide/nickel transport system permease protein|nr:ABC transporter permease [Tepidisphaeraceae bacterium]